MECRVVTSAPEQSGEKQSQNTTDGFNKLLTRMLSLSQILSGNFV